MTGRQENFGTKPMRARAVAAMLLLGTCLSGIGATPSLAQSDSAAAQKAEAAELIKARRFNEALKILNRLQADGDVETYILLSKAYLETGAGIAAEAALERARRLGADYANTAVPYAKALLVQGRFAEAMESLRGVNIPAEFRQDALIISGDANFAERRYDEAKRSYEQVLKDYGPNFQAYLGMARLRLRQGDLEGARKLAEKAHEQAPQNTMVQYTRGLIARYQGDIPAAETFFLDALKLYPGNILVNLELAAIRINQGRLNEAEEYLDAVYAVSAKHPMALYLSGAILASRGQYEEANALLLRAREVTERYLPAMYVRGLVSYQLGDYQVAENLLSTVIRARPANRAARLALAGTYLRQQRPTAAYELLLPMLQATGEKDPGVVAMAAAAAMASGRTDEGARLYSTLSAEDAKAQTHVLKGLPAKLALATYVEGDTEGALAALSAVAAGQDKDLRDLGILGGMQLQTGDYEGAQVTIATILKAAPDRALGYNMRGTLEYQRQQYRDAIRSFSQALDRNSDYYTALRNRGLALMQIEQYDAAEKDLKRLLTLQPGDVRAKAVLGRALLRAGKYGEAVEYFRTAVQALPAAVDVWADYSDALAGAGHTTEAISQARETAVLGADRPDILKRMGMLLLKLNQPGLASRPLSRYVAFDPDNGEAHMLQARAMLAAGLYTGARISFQRAMQSAKAPLGQDEGNWYLFAVSALGRHYQEAKRLLPLLVPSARPSDVRASVVGNFLMASGDTDAAILAFRDAMASDPSSDAAVGLASALGLTDQKGQAINILRSFIDKNPEDRNARMELGRQLEMDGRTEEAAKQYERVLKTGVADAQVIARLALAYLRLGNRTSIPLAERAYLILPEDPSILDTYGWIMLQAARDTGKAIVALERATRRAPAQAEYKYHLGMAYLAEGRRADARRMLEQALKLDPNFADADDARRQVSLLE
ncbi:MAG: PEP-CTERM system TPR-repeat protein PrsT [Alphaproteobacteria bacterium]|nr:MAG: PEP-CTERM system TPR-repeat protein PrsT [Alphaproteobacteria bacterium]